MWLKPPSISSRPQHDGVRVNYSTLDDATLLRLISHARTEALSELYDRYSRLVFSLALNVVGDHPTAEEITQDVFTSVWEKAATYRVEQSKVSTWLSSITRYRSIDILRRRGSRPEQHSVSWADINPGSEPHTEDTQHLAELSLLQQRVRAAVASLPREQQEALALAYFKGYSHTEIAEALSEPLGTVKTRIRLGMQKLRQQLDEEVRPA